jgi:hypothetical protein
VVVIYAIFKNYGTASYGKYSTSGWIACQLFLQQDELLVGEFMAAEPAALSFSFLGTLKQKMPSSVISSFGVKGRAGPGSS